MDGKKVYEIYESMSVEESPASLLQRAADRLEERAKHTTRVPWEARSLPGESAANVVFRPPWSITGFASLFNSTCCSGNCWGHVADENDAAWIAALSPAVAAPLVTWLRAIAENMDRAGIAEDWARAVFPAEARAALDFARVVLGLSVEEETT